MVLLRPWLSLSVEKHYVVCVALEEIVAVFGLAVGAVSGILYDVDTFMEKNQGVGVGV